MEKKKKMKVSSAMLQYLKWIERNPDASHSEQVTRMNVKTKDALIRRGLLVYKVDDKFYLTDAGKSIISEN